ncbi:MazF family transcriptional regulator [Candidatus Kaiserbacteria bacterium]|nr:MazF family transcriptional regulator [Candidatus Kaiserbacteria bacterium]
MAQKIIQIGSSAGVTLSPDTLEALNVKIGDAVEMSVHPTARVLTVQPKSNRNENPVNPDVIAWTNVFIDKNRKLLERLADK